jgi:DNA-binding transcriptional ArsR family regulator
MLIIYTGQRGDFPVDTVEQQQDLDAILAALAHEVRRHVLLVVWCHGGAMSAGEIARRFTHSWPTTSRHLRVLQQAGLLVLEKQGRTRAYRVQHARLQLVQDWLRWFQQIPAEQTASAPERPEVLLRNIALAYPEAAETLAPDGRLIKVRKRAFVVLRGEGDVLCLSVRLLSSRPAALALPFVQPVQYRLGKSDWITARFDPGDELPIELLWEWIDESYRAAAPALLVSDLGPPPRALR